jgi:hypothetical protein
MTKKKNLVIVVLSTFVLVSTLFMVLPTRSQTAGEYDPWEDLNDDGIINLYDAVELLNSYGMKGTPINKTQLLLELQARLDALNATVMTLKELMEQSQNCQVETGTGTGVFLIEANFTHAFPNGTIPKVFVMAVLKADDPGASGLLKGMCVYPELFSVTNTRLVVMLKDEVGGVNLVTATADIYYIAIGKGSPIIPCRHCANTQQLVTSGNQITITFPVGMFTIAPNLSVTVFMLGGMYAGETCYISGKSVSAASATLSLKAWDGAVWQDIADSELVQVSWVAVENNT